MSASPSPEDSRRGIKNQRRWSRFAADHPKVQLETSHGPRLGYLLNESFSGVGLLLEDAAGLRQGQQLEVIYYGAPVTGVVRRLVCFDDDVACEVGIEWLDRRLAEHASEGARKADCAEDANVRPTGA